MLKKLILTTMLVGVCCVVSAQVTIKGRVLNSETGEPVVGANIRVDHSLHVLIRQLQPELQSLQTDSPENRSP